MTQTAQRQTGLAQMACVKLDGEGHRVAKVKSEQDYAIKCYTD